MTRDEAITIVGMVANGWPGGAWDADRMGLYVEAIMPLDAAQTTRALLRAQQTLRYRPSVAELREFVHIEQRLAEPDDPSPRRPEERSTKRPFWTVRWGRARASNDWRHFPEQCEYVAAQEPFTDRAVWVQPDEYLDEGGTSALDAIVELPDVAEEGPPGL